MRQSKPSVRLALTGRALVGIVLSALVIPTWVSTGHALQLIPSVGYTKSTDTNVDNGNFYGGVALRASLMPMLSIEGGIAYREDQASTNSLKVRMWPVTASAWLHVLPTVYAGGGLGWYRTTYDYSSSVPFSDVTTDLLGVHLGGGVAVPLSPSLGLDLNGRYIFMQKDNSLKLPTDFNPNFWSTTVGLAIKF